jgi:hypothetical protein
LRLLLDPDELGPGVLRQQGAQIVRREGVELLQDEDG